MRFSTNQHTFYCGIALHARSMDVCLLSHAGASLLHRHMQAAPEPLRKAIAPDREGLVVDGGTAQHDRIASHTIAVVLRGGLLPQA